ncbi:MAG: right-handed parallel beta-helix repeat-containing protein [Bacteroidales bacterium]|nr:right-handed parallel beta-helix repeat-containing protein [Bacteroidales bacterium]
MKTIFYNLTLLLFAVSNVFSQTNVPGGVVNGTWTLAGSPYLVQGSIQIIDGDSLIIQPGVTVSFQGTYKLLVLGKLKAIGTVTDTITFTAVDPIGGWRGIRFDNTPSTNDTSRIIYCKIEFGNASGNVTPEKHGGGIYFDNFSKAIVYHSSIVNCKANRNGSGIYIDSSSPIIKNNSISNNTSSMNDRGGAICIKFGNPTISNNIITNNTGNHDGGGIYIEGGSATIIYNIITYNTAGSGGGITISMGSPTISNNTISNNFSTGNGGGINIEPGFSPGPTISNNIISNNTGQNTGGGINCHGGAIINNNSIFNNTSSSGGGIVSYTQDIIISNNFISNNTVPPSTWHYQGGGGIWCVSGSSGVEIFNNVISNNSAPNGGGLLCYNSSPTFTNNTVANNSASNNGGALSCSGCSPNFLNCIFWGNTALTSGVQAFLYDESCDPNFNYCDVEGGSAAFELNGNFYTGTYLNNIDTDPLFVAPSGGSGTGFNGMAADWSLQNISLCIDAGDPSGTYPPTDIVGNPRVLNIIDIGAYESGGTTGINENYQTSVINVYPNPSSGRFTLESSIVNIYKIEIYNVIGERIYETTNMKKQSSNEIDLSCSPKGIYFVRIYNGTIIYDRIVVVQ